MCITWRFPVRQGGGSTEQPQILLPVTQGPGIALVYLHQIRHRNRARIMQQPVQCVAECAEMLVMRIAQSEHGIVQARKVRLGGIKACEECSGIVGRVAFAGCCRDEQRLFCLCQHCRRNRRKRTQRHRPARNLQRLRGCLCQARCCASLAGIDHQHRAGSDRSRLAPAMPPQRPAHQREPAKAGQACQQKAHALAHASAISRA